MERQGEMAETEMRFGGTGKFPEGKLNPGDEGELKLIVAEYMGKVS